MAKSTPSGPRHKVREVKKKTIVDKLKNSALFILLLIIVFTVDVVSFIFWISGILSGELEEARIFTSTVFFLWVGITAVLVAFFITAKTIQRKAYG